MKRFSRLLALLLAVAMLALCALPLVSCGNTPPDDEEPGDKCENHVDTDGDGKCDNDGCNEPVESDATASYAVKIQSVGGLPLPNVYVDLIDKQTNRLVTYGKTNDSGEVTFTASAVGQFAVELSDGVPSGYVVREQYDISAAGTVIRLATEILPATSLSSGMYSLGSIMRDFTLTDTDGNKITLSQLFEDGKQLVVLNFWYTTCTYCIQEFPDMQKAYEAVIDEETGEKYKDKVEIIALNIWDESNGEINSFKDGLGLTFPTARDIGLYAALGFDKAGVAPCTAVIDRYGMVSILEAGAVLGSTYWKKAFSVFTSEEYTQSTFESIYELSPVELPTVSMPDSDVIYENFVKDGATVDVEFSPETKPGDAEYSWPFIVAEKDGYKCIIPSNGKIPSGSDSKEGTPNSYSILYATVELDAGEALLFDFFCSTESNEYTGDMDIFYVIVDGQDMFQISGVSDDGVWETCCAFVAETAGTYEVALSFIKDSTTEDFDNVLDSIFLKDLRVIDKSEIDIENVYIYRDAATGLTPDNYEYTDYVDVFYNSEDGYYHVGSENGPILLANLLGYTNFDDSSAATIRFYENDTFMVGDVDKYYHFELYLNYALNSSHYSYCPVTAELKECLDAYVSLYCDTVGKLYCENTWLQLCLYFDAYGTVAEPFEDPIKGLASFSAFDAVVTPIGAEEPVLNKVTYNKLILPRGLLYKFVPEVSGIYRVLTQSEKETDGWIFVGNHGEWAENNGQRILYATSAIGERYTPQLIVDTNNDGIYERDFINSTMIAYFEAGVEYYVVPAFNNYETMGSFTFTITPVTNADGELMTEFDVFQSVSPGPFTAEENSDGSLGNIIAGNVIDMVLDEDGYYYHKIGVDESGNPILGSMIYADFIWTTGLFPVETIKDLIDKHAFDFSKTALDLQVLIMYNNYGRLGYTDMWYEEYKLTLFETKWTEELGPEWDSENADTDFADEEARAEAKAEAKLNAKAEFIDEIKAFEDDFDTAFRNKWNNELGPKWDADNADADFADAAAKAAAKAEARTAAEEEYKQKLDDMKNDFEETYLQEKLAIHGAELDAISEGIYVGTYYDTEFAVKFDLFAREGINNYFGAESDEELEEYLESYKVDDVLSGKFHGNGANLTAQMKAIYDEHIVETEDGGIEYDENYPERQGCVPVTEEIANLLQRLVDKFSFSGVKDAWAKLCYYYQHIGPAD